MSKQGQFSLFAMSILLASSMLAGCGGSNGGGGGADNSAAESSEAAKAPVAASTPPSATSVPVAYTPEPGAGVVTTCNIEKFDDAPFQSAPDEAMLSEAHTIGGWIAAPQLTAPSFWLRLDDKAQSHYFQVPLALSVKRPDVVSSAANSVVPLLSGYLLKLPAHAVPAGQYHLYLVARADGKISICDSGRHVDFK